MDTPYSRRMARERIQTRDDPDVKEAVEEYAEEKDITEAEAVRRLVRTGLDAKGYDTPGTTGRVRLDISLIGRLGGGLLMAALLLWLTIQFL